MKKLVKESLNEYERIENFDSTQVEKKWADEMMDALKNWKVTEFGGSLPVENIKLEFLSEFAADVTASVQVRPDIRFDLYFALRNNQGLPYPQGWFAEVAISSPARKGFFSKKASGKNVAPQALLQLLTNIFNLKYTRR